MSQPSKKLKGDEISILINENLSNFEFFSSLKSMCIIEKFPFYIEKTKFLNLIGFYYRKTKIKITKSKKLKEKDLDLLISSNSNSKKYDSQIHLDKNLESILSKYGSQIESKPLDVEIIPLKFDKLDHELRMNLFIVNPEIFKKLYNNDLNEITNFLNNYQIDQDENIKNLFIFEGMNSYFTSQKFKAKFIDSNKRLEKNEEENFIEWLIDLNIIHSFDYKLTETISETIDYIKKLSMNLISSKNKKPEILVNRENTHTHKSKLAGLDNIFTLMWVDILMAIPGISEDKAISIVKAYPTLKSLMKAYENCENESQKESLLKNIQIFYKLDESKSKNLGIKISNRVYKIFTCNDEKKIVMD